MNIFTNYISPREHEITCRDIKRDLPKGWCSVCITLDGAVANILSYGHETGLPESIIFRRLVMSIPNWRRVRYRRFHSRCKLYPIGDWVLFSETATLCLTDEEHKELLSCAKRKHAGIGEFVNAICAEHFRDKTYPRF